jgi:hypothetical protein
LLDKNRFSEKNRHSTFTPQTSKMDRVILGLFLMLTQHTMAQNISLGWVESFHGTNQEVGKAVVKDVQGNVYTTGYFLGTVDFDPGINMYPLSSSGQQDIFISKLDMNGQFLWAKRIGGSGNDISNAITIDMEGNIYVTGFFRNTVDFNPGVGMYYQSTFAAGSQDIFICKLDSSGHFRWATCFGGNGYYDSIGNLYPAVSVGYDIKTDAFGNVYSTGSYLGSIDFDPDAGINILTSLTVPNIFISKLDTAGHFVWARSMGDNKLGDEAYAISLDDSGNVYTTGVFGDTADFDPGPATYQLISSGYNQAFVSKLDSSGHFVWAKNMGGHTINDQAAGRCIEVDVHGDIVVGGHYKGGGDFDPGNGIITFASNGNYDMFLTKLSSQGNLIWCKSIGGTSSDQCTSISTDLSGNVYATGSFSGQVNFNPTVGTSLLNSSAGGTSDIFVLKLNTLGHYQWACSMGGTGNDAGNAIRTDQSGSLFVTGYYSGLADFDPTIIEANVMASGGFDIFLLKLIPNSMVLPLTIIRFCGTEVQASNLLTWETGNELNTDYIEIQKSRDAKNFSTIGMIECVLHNTPHSSYCFMDNRKQDGVNYYRLKLVDLDKQYQYSSIISVVNDEGPPNIVVYPNPCVGELTMLSSTYIRQGTISLTDSKSQRTLLKTNLTGISFKVNISNYPDGIYAIALDEDWPYAIKHDKQKAHAVMIQLRK